MAEITQEENVEDFLDRVYINFCKDKVFVYQNKSQKGRPKFWTVDQAKQYIRYLESKKVMEI